uniref:KH domain-containing, RNA-binding, signal transduction-associated protein 1-like n=1 Tax=Nyctereutes procyonoides TaxID=34880 RepID=UPI002443C6A1|nr:KH domain-containing, RNA-binding, signal transduction-associated protein 1-like [Nyctereutes procyonoides]
MFQEPAQGAAPTPTPTPGRRRGTSAEARPRAPRGVVSRGVVSRGVGQPRGAEHPPQLLPAAARPRVQEIDPLLRTPEEHGIQDPLPKEFPSRCANRAMHEQVANGWPSWARNSTPGALRSHYTN